MKTTEQLLQNELDSLKNEIQPERDLWNGIDHSINRTFWHSHFSVKNIAVAASFALVLSFAIIQSLRPTANNIDEGLIQLMSALQLEHKQNKQALLVKFTENIPSYQDWENEMQELENAEALLYQSLLKEPNNLTILTILRQVQNKQLELLSTVYTPRLTSI